MLKEPVVNEVISGIWFGGKKYSERIVLFPKEKCVQRQSWSEVWIWGFAGFSQAFGWEGLWFLAFGFF